MKTNQMRTGKGYFFRACYRKGVSHHHMFWQRLKGLQKWESFTGENKEAIRYALLGGCWCGEAISRLTRSRASYTIG